MSEVLSLLADQMVTAVSGAVTTGVVWIAAGLYRAKRDLDEAHDKIRALSKRLDSLEQRMDQ